MNGTPKDIDPESDLREEDDEQALPELEQAEAPAGPPSRGRSITHHLRPASIA